MAQTAPSRTHRSNYWRDLTEKELLELEFTTSEPELLESMSDEPPPPGPVIIEFKYDLRGRPSKARCVHCKFNNHFRGFVIRVADGSRRLVGKDCGRKLYGGHFDEAHQDFKSAQKLASALKRRMKLLDAEPIFTEGLRLLIDHPSLRQFTRMSGRVKFVLGDDVAGALDVLAKRGDGFIISEKIRDFAAEERSTVELSSEHVGAINKLNRAEQKRYRRRHGLPNTELYTWVNRSIGPLKGTALLYSRFSPAERLDQLQRDVSNCFGGLRQKRDWKEASLSAASKHLADLVSQVERQIEKLRAPIDFFNPTHLRNICEWDKHRPNGVGFRCGPTWIERFNDYDETARAELFQGYEMPPTDFITAFRTAIESGEGASS